MKLVKNAVFGLSLLTMAISNTSIAAEKQDKLKDTDFVNNSSYALGVLMAKDLEHIMKSQEMFITYNKEQVAAGFQDSLKNKSKIDDKALQTQLQDLDEALGQARDEVASSLANENEQKGKAFREQYAKKSGVKQTKSGILYHIEKQGSGAKAKPEDVVKVHYKGSLINGDVFDSSYDRGEPVQFKLNQLIPGWVEGIQLIQKGGKIELVLPPELGYGKDGNARIPANSTLVFEVELLDINPKADSK